HAEPDVDLVAGIEFADGRQVGKSLGARLAARRERSQIAGFELAGARRAREQHLGLAADGRGRRRRAAAIGTCSRFMPARRLSASMAKCCWLPTPPDA